jgi:hypothetical protein
MEALDVICACNGIEFLSVKKQIGKKHSRVTRRPHKAPGGPRRRGGSRRLARAAEAPLTLFFFGAKPAPAAAQARER